MEYGLIRDLKSLFQTIYVNFDETVVRLEDSTKWVHNYSNEKYTYLTVNKKRTGRYSDNGVITNFTGTAVHDCWRTYCRFDNIS